MIFSTQDVQCSEEKYCFESLGDDYHTCSLNFECQSCWCCTVNYNLKLFCEHVQKSRHMAVRWCQICWSDRPDLACLKPDNAHICRSRSDTHQVTLKSVFLSGLICTVCP